MFCSQIEVAVAVVVTAEHVGERYERGLGAYGRFGSGVWGEGEGLPDLSQKNAEIEIEVGSRVWGSFMDKQAPCQKQFASMGGCQFDHSGAPKEIVRGSGVHERLHM